jgi:hypothetical protein
MNAGQWRVTYISYILHIVSGRLKTKRKRWVEHVRRMGMQMRSTQHRGRNVSHHSIMKHTDIPQLRVKWIIKNMEQKCNNIANRNQIGNGHHKTNLMLIVFNRWELVKSNHQTGWSRFDLRQRQRISPLTSCVQTVSGAHPASCPMGNGGSFPGDKSRPGRDADHSPPSSAEVVTE